jgi:outer membrane protein assembly factor BamB
MSTLVNWTSKAYSVTKKTKAADIASHSKSSRPYSLQFHRVPTSLRGITMLRSSPVALFVICVLAGAARADNWPSWRGAAGQGHAADKDLPLTWSEKENIRWKAVLPDSGNASPVVWGDRIFVTQCTDKGKKRGVLCLDRATGKQLWFTTVDFDGNEPTHGTNPYGAATCATDGERVIAGLASAGVICLDFDGKLLWRKDLGKFIHIWGTASSPVIHGEVVYLWCGPGERQFLIALNKATGEELWRHDEPGGKDGLDNVSDNWIGSWSTPVIALIGGREQIVLSVPKKVKGFDPRTGKEIWSCEGLSNLVYTSPVVSADGVVIVMSGYGGPALAVKAGGSGDITKDRLWHHPRNPQRIGSAVIIGEHAFIMNEPGLASCYELKSGKDLWKQERLTGATWGSMVHADGRLYVTSSSGETVVLKADPKLEVLAKNRLPDQVQASIAVSKGELFIRGYKFLWCVSAKK